MMVNWVTMIVSRTRCASRGNNTVLALMDCLGVRNVPSQMRLYAAHPHRALALLIGQL
jgi:hypothetical protein